MGMYLINEKRPIVGKYLRGETDNEVEAAQALSDEFASIPDPKTGRSKGIEIVEIIMLQYKSRGKSNRHLKDLDQIKFN